MRKKIFSHALGTAMLLAPLGSYAVNSLPPTVKVDLGKTEEVCSDATPPEWRKEQVVEGVKIQESRLCNPDNPFEIAAFVKGTNNISMDTLMETQLAADSVIKKDDMDGDGDPDFIIIKMEVAELNGHSPDFSGLVTTFDIAPGVQPGFWVFAPKTRDMSTSSFVSLEANPLLRVPSPVIRVEEGDVVWLVLENTHYLPHTIHLHGIDHPYMDHSGEGNDGVGQTSAMEVKPGESKTYVIKPRQPGTQYYHCHVQPHTHIAMGLQGMFIVEENRPNNWLQTFNVGAGHVRHPSVAVREQYATEYDLHYESVDKELHSIVQNNNDPRLIAQRMNLEYDITDADDDYFLLNGRSFPYTVRESMIVMEPNKKAKLRILNGFTEEMAWHTHGHKPTATHYDGVDNGPQSRITRDVHAIATAQRLDLEMSGQDDGLHSFGEGVWMFHDHHEKTFTTDGVGEGGAVSLIAYKSFLNEKGIPALHGMSLAPYFSKKFWEKKYPLWQDYDSWGSLGQPEMQRAPGEAEEVSSAGGSGAAASGSEGSSVFSQLLSGLILGILAYVAFNRREQIYKMLPRDKISKLLRGES
ncbi:MAG: multicopper oxidase domain-containing protein [Gammaproteobacteria bacterium]